MTASPLRRTLLATLAILPALSAASMAQDENATRDRELAERRQELDRLYTFGPTAARSLGYRITWQSSMDTPIKRMDVVGPDVYVIDDRNVMTRIDRANGSPVWSVTAADPNDTVWGVTEGMTPINGLPWGQNDGDKLYVTTDPVVFGIDHATGAIVERQDLEQIPSTDVLRWRNYLIFGTRHGRVVWHQYVVGHEWRANQLAGPVVAMPTLVGDSRIAVASLGGNVLMLSAKSAGRVWGDKTFAAVKAPMTTGGGLIFAACEDQYLWTFDADRGDVVWRYFTESKLDTQPTYVEVNTADGNQGRVLQWVETEGLVCLEADPENSIEGKPLWKIRDARGEAVGLIGDHVALWDDSKRVLRTIDAAQGSIVQTIKLPQVRSLTMHDDVIYATSDDGRIIRLDPIG
ncbi:MAG: hypothetical protein CMJ34_05505 [Phycisphaerae bacterium]|nr:hypothetical protein [Phycisphaerae bacterium]